MEGVEVPAIGDKSCLPFLFSKLNHVLEQLFIFDEYVFINEEIIDAVV